MAKSLKKLTTSTLMLLTIAAIANLRGLPSNAEQGMQLIFYLGVSALIFFIPTALVSAELATGWKGGVFDWVKVAYGDKWGFVAIWLQWIQNVVWYPTVLSFMAGALAFIINPNLASNGVFTAIVILTVYWSSTLVSLRGIKFASKISSFGVMVGTLIPGLIIILLGGLYLAQGKPTAIELNVAGIVPNEVNLTVAVFMIGMILSYAGVEMNAVHARDIKNPNKTFPLAILGAVIVIVGLFILASMAVAIVVPANQLSLTSGILDAYQKFFAVYNIPWAVHIIAALLAIGVVAAVVTWVSGPSRGLLRVGEEGYLPRWLQKTNKHGVQSSILFFQALIVTGLAAFFVFLPNVSSSYWVLTTVTIQLYLIMYVLLFLTAIKLRRTKPNVKRPYKVPGLYVVSTIGLITCVGAFFLGFVPPSLWKGSAIEYGLLLCIGIILLGVGPFIFYGLRKTKWKTRK